MQDDSFLGQLDKPAAKKPAPVKKAAPIKKAAPASTSMKASGSGSGSIKTKTELAKEVR